MAPAFDGGRAGAEDVFSTNENLEHIAARALGPHTWSRLFFRRHSLRPGSATHPASFRAIELGSYLVPTWCFPSAPSPSGAPRASGLAGSLPGYLRGDLRDTPCRQQKKEERRMFERHITSKPKPSSKQQEPQRRIASAGALRRPSTRHRLGYPLARLLRSRACLRFTEQFRS